MKIKKIKKNLPLLICGILCMTFMSSCIAAAPQKAPETNPTEKPAEPVANAETSTSKTPTATLDPNIVVIKPFDQSLKVDPNEVKVEKEKFELNGHTYEYDVVSSATKSVKVDDTKPTKPYEEKLAEMFWSVQPPLGLVEGEYYKREGYFNYDEADILNSAYIAIAEVVKKDDKINYVELNEVAPLNYYDPNYRGFSKILSEYGFFQVESQRTDNTLVNLNNAFSFMEYQMVKENRITGPFKTVKGQSNSIYSAFFPLMDLVAEDMKNPTQLYYYSYAEKLPNGLTPRLVVITDGGKIIKAHYDEIFADTPEEIENPDLQKYYRTSKYGSVHYSSESGSNFREFSDSLEKAIVEKQAISDIDSAMTSYTNMSTELENYKNLAKKIRTAIENNHFNFKP